MNITTNSSRVIVFAFLLTFLRPAAAPAQVSPAEIVNPKLKAAEQSYFSQLVEMNRAIGKIKFPFPFQLSRVTGLAAKEQAGADRRGLEFVLYHDHVILKVSGDYGAAFNSSLLTQNERVARVLDGVVSPVLQLVPKIFPPGAAFDGFGFEVLYHVRSQKKSYDYEGSEMLTIVFEKSAAFRYLAARMDSERQEILNAADVFVSGKAFGPALGSRDPLDVDTLERQQWAAASVDTRTAATKKTESPSVSSGATGDSSRQAATDAPATRSLGSLAAVEPAAKAAQKTPAQAQADALQARYQAQLAALARDDAERFHFVDYAPPFFAVFQDRVYLQITLRNPASFDRNATSLYKRTAQTFDLFLAPLLKPLLAKLPAIPDVAGADVTVLDQLTPAGNPSSEAVEFICPMEPLRRFAAAEITNQDLINQSVVLVNGVRIALNLQAVE